MKTEQLHINTIAGYEDTTGVLEAAYVEAHLMPSEKSSFAIFNLPLATRAGINTLGEKFTILIEPTKSSLTGTEGYGVRSAVDSGQFMPTIEMALCAYITKAYRLNVGSPGFCEQLVNEILPAMACNITPIAEAVGIVITSLHTTN